MTVRIHRGRVAEHNAHWLYCEYMSVCGTGEYVCIYLFVDIVFSILGEAKILIWPWVQH